LVLLDQVEPSSCFLGKSQYPVHVVGQVGHLAGTLRDLAGDYLPDVIIHNLLELFVSANEGRQLCSGFECLGDDMASSFVKVGDLRLLEAFVGGVDQRHEKIFDEEHFIGSEFV